MRGSRSVSELLRHWSMRRVRWFWMGVMAAKKKAPRDVNANVSRIFGEMIERSEQPPNRGSLKKVTPPPAKKSGATR